MVETLKCPCCDHEFKLVVPPVQTSGVVADGMPVHCPNCRKTFPHPASTPA